MRYLRLYRHFFLFSVSKAMEFRVDFCFRILMDLLIYIMNFMFFNVIFNHTELIAGWDIHSMRIFIAGFLMVDALNMTFFANNAWYFPFAINRGDLDYYLVRPVSPLFFLSLREFAVNSFVNLLMAMSLMTWAISSYPNAIAWWKIVIYLSFLLNGAVLYFMTQMIFFLPIFWTQSNRGLGELFYSITMAYERPDRIFTGAIRFLFTTILPFTLMASFPARLILDTWDWSVFIHLIVGTLGFWGLFYFLWTKALGHYSSASS